MNENSIGKIIVDAAVLVHMELGPGLLENIYEVILAYELEERGLLIERQISMPINYKDITLNEGFRIDILVENKVVVELKSVEHLNKVYKKQVLTYLKLSGFKLGYLLNFGEALMKDGISRIINGKLT